MPRVAAITATNDALSLAGIKDCMVKLEGVNSFKLRNCFVKIKKCENTLVKKKRGKLSK